MRLRTRITLLCCTVIAAVSGLTVPAQAAPVVLAQGYHDAIDVQYNGGRLELWVLDNSVSPPLVRDPANVVFQVKPSAQAAVPNRPEFAFLGSPGAPVWILPQTENQDLLWPTITTWHVPAGVFRNDQLTVRLLNVQGPNGFSMFTTRLGSVSVHYDSEDGLPDSLTLGLTRLHAAWAFEATGTYTLTFEVAGTRASDGALLFSNPVQYHFVVGGLS
ncbi:hypothetical protein DMH04_45885 [Kibdelosporangium aridum]|uniref:Surface-anchored protein n=1 Tax=Kibdelosporangium aridum TaxID=2030 RepID=A0A428YN22_KIBAR|nr:choice-of-anchor M domain-containing protein [Kibdelosporangium aridum]RSM69654.1 hypothetical protein DMH04_45885 [Kibdelosporangium aridum]